MSDSPRLDTYIREAQYFVETDQLDPREVNYKREIAKQMRRARNLVFADDREWPSAVEKGLNSNLSNLMSRAVLISWFKAEPTTARAALMELWTDGRVPVGERIRQFLTQVPTNPKRFTGTGTRLREVAALLIALGGGSLPAIQDHGI